MASGFLAAAEDPADGKVLRLAEIEVTSSHVSALTQAPTESKLETFRPQSIISIDYIANHVAPTADYATIANIAPSVSNVETNGPGLSESKHLTIRGFDDASYNVTFDDIPFGDYNTYSHHTTSYFPAKLVGQVVVDRGPGTAGTLGNATFGGTLALYSKDPRTDLALIPTLSYGSWNTQLAHLEFNSGQLASVGNGSLIASAQKMTTDGFRTNSDMTRWTYYAKYIQPLGKNTTLTILGTYNDISFSNPGTVTQAQIDFFGRDFGLTSNTLVPAGTPNNVGSLAVGKPDTLNRDYNYQEKQADFAYIGLNTKLGGGWSVEDKIYTYSYTNGSHESPKVKTVNGVDDVIGSFKINRYRTYGDSFALVNDSTVGTFKTGVWYDTTRNVRSIAGVNYTTTGADAVDVTTATNQFAPVAANPLTAVGAPFYNYSYHLIDSIKTYQLFAEYEWRATSQLTINPGVKYFSVTRDMDAQVLQTKARLPLNASHTDTRTMPFLAANYMFTKEWSGYAQFAEGMLSPSEKNTFYVSDLTSNVVKPQLSTNYQIGTVFKNGRFNADVDAYWIDFKNYQYSAGTAPSGDPLYFGVAQGAHYSGAEAEGTFYVGSGLSLYANASLNYAKFKGSNLTVPTVPESTAAFGFVYNSGGFFASLDEKFVGRTVVYDNITNPDIAGGGATRRAKSDSYALGDLSFGYSHRLTGSFFRSYKVRLQVSNVFDKKVQVLDSIDPSAANAYTKDAYNVLPGRNYFLTISGEF